MPILRPRLNKFKTMANNTYKRVEWERTKILGNTIRKRKLQGWEEDGRETLTTTVCARDDAGAQALRSVANGCRITTSTRLATRGARERPRAPRSLGAVKVKMVRKSSRRIKLAAHKACLICVIKKVTIVKREKEFHFFQEGEYVNGARLIFFPLRHTHMKGVC